MLKALYWQCLKLFTCDLNVYNYRNASIHKKTAKWIVWCDVNSCSWSSWWGRTCFSNLRLGFDLVNVFFLFCPSIAFLVLDSCLFTKMGWNSGWFLANEILSSLPLPLFSFTLLSEDHCASRSASCCGLLSLYLRKQLLKLSYHLHISIAGLLRHRYDLNHLSGPQLCPLGHARSDWSQGPS